MIINDSNQNTDLFSTFVKDHCGDAKSFLNMGEDIVKNLIPSLTEEEKKEYCFKFMKAFYPNIGGVSDGYHTFDELYHHRALLFASLLVQPHYKSIAWKSLLHNDPNYPMYPGMFIVGIDTPYGQASYHYDIDPYWSIFKDIKEVKRAPKFDGHTPNQAIERIYKYALDVLKPATRGAFDETHQ